jgi:hypothetical protein
VKKEDAAKSTSDAAKPGSPVKTEAAKKPVPAKVDSTSAVTSSGPKKKHVAAKSKRKRHAKRKRSRYRHARRATHRKHYRKAARKRYHCVR